MPSAPLRNPDSARARLYSKSRPAGDCLIFTGALHQYGYGKLWDGERVEVAHRLSWRLEFGPIPDGIHVCHTCDNPPCFLPAHLFLGSQRDNLADMRRKGRGSEGPEHGAHIRAGWTPEKRAARSRQAREAKQARREAAAIAAGHPADWKRCPRCCTWKAPSGYYRNAARFDGLKPHCKPCSVTLDLARRNRTN